MFVDRDGTLNEHRGYITGPDSIVLLPGVAEGVRRLNRRGLPVVVITNQPVIARGETSFEGLEAIHARLRALLRAGGAALDAIYFCPHHPEKGGPGEIAEFKIDCDCRKPKTGLVERAAREMNIELAGSWMIGDTTRDVLMAQRAGLRSIQVRTGEGAGEDRKFDVRPDFLCDDFGSAVDIILESEPAR